MRPLRFRERAYRRAALAGPRTRLGLLVFQARSPGADQPGWFGPADPAGGLCAPDRALSGARHGLAEHHGQAETAKPGAPLRHGSAGAGSAFSGALWRAHGAYRRPSASSLLAVSLGTALGALAGYFGGITDEAIMRVTDVFLAFPPLLLAMTIAAVLKPSLPNTIVAICITWWPWYARIARAQALSLRERDYVRAARGIGVGDITIIRRHILPNLMTPILIQATLDLGAAILTVSALSFVGLGVPPPTADWGAMISEGRIYIQNGRWWVPTFPGLGALRHDYGGEPARRRHPGCGESAAAAGRRMKTETLLAIDDLRVDFPGPLGVSKAVRGISLTARRGEVFGIVGGERLRQDGDGTLYPGACAVAGAHHRRKHPLRWNRLDRAAGKPAGADPRQAHRHHDLSGSDGGVESAIHNRAAAEKHHAAAWHGRAARTTEAGDRLAGRVGDCRSRPTCSMLIRISFPAGCGSAP